MVGNPIINWSPDMTVGVATLDNEHRLLISEINVLKATSQSADRQAVESCLARLATYAVKHFHNEESYMAKIRYSRLNEHKEKHDEFTMRIQSFIVRLDSEDHTVVAIEILQFLVDWWTCHILTDDKHYALEADF